MKMSIHVNTTCEVLDKNRFGGVIARDLMFPKILAIRTVFTSSGAYIIVRLNGGSTRIAKHE